MDEKEYNELKTTVQQLVNIHTLLNESMYMGNRWAALQQATSYIVELYNPLKAKLDADPRFIEEQKKVAPVGS